MRNDSQAGARQTRTSLTTTFGGDSSFSWNWQNISPSFSVPVSSAMPTRQPFLSVKHLRRQTRYIPIKYTPSESLTRARHLRSCKARHSMMAATSSTKGFSLKPDLMSWAKGNYKSQDQSLPQSDGIEGALQRLTSLQRAINCSSFSVIASFHTRSLKPLMSAIASSKIPIMSSWGTPLAHMMLINCRFKKAAWYLAIWECTHVVNNISTRKRMRDEWTYSDDV